MSFSYSSSVITQSNEAGKSITSVSSVTGGVTVTVTSHGYSNDDYIEISGTTDYNGGWVISNTTTNTFDIVDQFFSDKTSLAFVSSQTGTAARGDKDISGVNGLTGVTTTTIDDVTYYDIGTNRMVVNGALKHDNVFHKLVSSHNPSGSGNYDNGSGNAAIDVNGRFRVGTLLLQNSIAYQTSAELIKLGVASPAAAPAKMSGIRAKSGGVIEWFSGTIRTSLTIGSANNNTANRLYVAGKECAIAGFHSSNQPMIRGTLVEGVEIRGLTFDGYEPANATMMFSIESFQVAEDFVFRAARIQARSGGSALLLTVSGLVVLLNRYSPDVGHNGNATQWATATTGLIQPIELINVDVGSAVVVEPNPSNPTVGSYGVTTVFQQINVHSKTTLGANLQGVKCVIPSTDNGGRRTPTGAGTVDHYNNWQFGGSDFDLYTATSDANGNSGTIKVLLKACVGDTTSGTGNIDEFLYNQSNVSGADDFTVYTYKYGYNAQPQAITLKSSSQIEADFPQVANILISQQTKATVDAYATIDTAQQGYDAIASEYEDSYFSETVFDTIPIGRAGNQLLSVSNRDLVLNAAAVAVRAYTASAVTFKTSTFAGGFDKNGGTGEVTLQNGVVLSGGTFNATINIDNASDGDTYTNVTIDKLVHSGTGVRSLTIDGGSVTEIEVSGGAVLTVTLLNSATITTLTETSGTITILRPVTISITVTDGDGAPIPSARVEILSEETVGTITSGDVILSGTTNGSGLIETTSFNYESAFQPSGLDISYKVRKASVSPYYKANSGIGTVSSTGFISNVQMTLDE